MSFTCAEPLPEPLGHPTRPGSRSCREGKPLFDRIGRRGELTLYGREVLLGARQIDSEADELAASAERMREGRAGSLRDARDRPPRGDGAPHAGAAREAGGRADDRRAIAVALAGAARHHFHNCRYRHLDGAD